MGKVFEHPVRLYPAGERDRTDLLRSGRAGGPGGGRGPDPVPGERGVGSTAKEEMSTMILRGIGASGGVGMGPAVCPPRGGAGPHRKRIYRRGGRAGPPSGGVLSGGAGDRRPGGADAEPGQRGASPPSSPARSPCSKTRSWSSSWIRPSGRENVLRRRWTPYLAGMSGCLRDWRMSGCVFGRRTSRTCKAACCGHCWAAGRRI